MNKLFSLLGGRRMFDSRKLFSNRINRLTADGKDIPKIKNFENRITLISPDNTVTITDLKNAQNLSVKRELKLVKIQDIDAKTRRPVYKMMTNVEYHEEELQKRKERQQSRLNSGTKGEKLLSFSTRIGEHDLMTHVNKIIKLLEKQYEVRVIINGDGSGEAHKSENLFSIIERNIKSLGKVAQRRNKGNSLRFQLLPNSKNKNSESPNDETPSGDNDNDSNKGPL